RIASVAVPPAGTALPDERVLATAFAQLAAAFDPEEGGFGRGAKFPMPGALDFLLRYHRRTGDARALAMVTSTLDRMAAGGIYDQLGGGFHRYATDRAWRVPHFEKMLADNAQLAALYVAAFQATGRPEFARVARETLAYLVRDMRAPEGGFYAASDADSLEGEGRYFTWTPGEIASALDGRDVELAVAAFGVTADGDVDGRSVLHATRAGPVDDE